MPAGSRSVSSAVQLPALELPLTFRSTLAPRPLSELEQVLARFTCWSQCSDAQCAPPEQPCQLKERAADVQVCRSFHARQRALALLLCSHSSGRSCACSTRTTRLHHAAVLPASWQRLAQTLDHMRGQISEMQPIMAAVAARGTGGGLGGQQVPQDSLRSQWQEAHWQRRQGTLGPRTTPRVYGSVRLVLQRAPWLQLQQGIQALQKVQVLRAGRMRVPRAGHMGVLRAGRIGTLRAGHMGELRAGHMGGPQAEQLGLTAVHKGMPQLGRTAVRMVILLLATMLAHTGTLHAQAAGTTAVHMGTRLAERLARTAVRMAILPLGTLLAHMGKRHAAQLWRKAVHMATLAAHRVLQVGGHRTGHSQGVLQEPRSHQELPHRKASPQHRLRRPQLPCLRSPRALCPAECCVSCTAPMHAEPGAAQGARAATLRARCQAWSGHAPSWRASLVACMLQSTVKAMHAAIY
jgi:hypothetical protein